MYASTYVCMCEYTDAYMPMHTYKDQRTLGVFHFHSLPYPLETSLILNLSINVFWLGWQPGSLSDLHYSAPPSSPVLGLHAPMIKSGIFFTCGPRIRIQILMLAHKTMLPLNHLLSLDYRLRLFSSCLSVLFFQFYL